ncbi:MAG: DNA polymerase I, partial [Muribaculaceae bacterium]|nr:DNA polymerase I [Muribaculaceae bacterium]
MEEKKLFLLDAYALIYRGYYALINSPRVTSKGFNTSAVFGFCNTLRDVLNKENPGYIAVCFDPAGGHTFRHDAYPEYKAQRDKQPEDITLALPYIRRILAAYNIPAIEVPGFEADDVIGTLSRIAEAEGFTTYMMTPDKDYGQLVTDKVFMYRPSLRGQGFEIRGPQQVCERYGIERPEQVIDLLALEGDSSDNIPGCPGVGEKTAAKLIREWGSVDNLLANIGSLKGAIRTKVESHAEQIRFSRFLATIRTDVPLDITPDQLLRSEPDLEALGVIFSELEFKQLAHQVGAKLAPVQPQPPVTGMASLFDAVEAEDSADHGIPAAPVAEKQIDIAPRIAASAAEASALLAAALGDSRLGISVEAPGEEAMRAPLQGVAVARADGSVFYIPVRASGEAPTAVLDLRARRFSAPAGTR